MVLSKQFKISGGKVEKVRPSAYNAGILKLGRGFMGRILWVYG